MIDPSREISRIIVEQMRVEDLDEVMIIEKNSFLTPWTKGMFMEELNKTQSICLVAKIPYDSGFERRQKVVGFVCSSFVIDELHILNIAVHPSYRRRGIATLLMEEVIKRGYKKGIRYIFLEVRIRNKAAISLYEKLGFRIVGLRRGYYSDTGEDALIMEKEIKGLGDI